MNLKAKFVESWGLSGMDYNFEQAYKEFEKIKSAKEFLEYCDDITKTSEVINKIPFDEEEAAKQISDMSKKYENELNWLARVYANGMTVVQNAPIKNEAELRNELFYINNQIPIIALMRELDSHALKKLLGID